MRRLAELLTLLWVAVFFSQCGGGGGDASTPAPAAPPAAAAASVRMSHTAIGLGVGQTAALKAEALAADGSVLAGKRFIFASSNAAVATVSVASAGADTATVAGVAVGGTVVTATVDGQVGTTGISVSGPPQENIPASGRVVDGHTQAGIAGASVAYETDNGQSGVVTSTADGSFTFSFAGDARAGTYRVDATASAAGYVTSTLWGAQVRPAGNAIESLQLVPARSVQDGTITGLVRDVRNGNAITGAAVRLEAGQGATTTVDELATSDAQGRYVFTGLPAGTYTVYASADRYTPGGRTAVTLPAGATREQNVGLSPLGAAPEVRIVLNWDAAPEDLDAHLTGPNAPGADGRFHAYFANRLNPAAAPYAGLDLDDRDGHGPETITLTRLNGGVYRFSVHDFSNRSSSPTSALGRSGATVQVIAGARTHTFHVPVQPGNLWTVFELSGDIANPIVTERGDMGMADDFHAIP
ncbi:MAG: carboxypeptidase regulatory-like domain-containing protein [Rubrivivax sp.]|nr:carboxypeptidase regulatory-like domain-containing protein [Rubrivivax sp.]